MLAYIPSFPFVATFGITRPDRTRSPIDVVYVIVENFATASFHKTCFHHECPAAACPCFFTSNKLVYLSRWNLDLVTSKVCHYFCKINKSYFDSYFVIVNERTRDGYKLELVTNFFRKKIVRVCLKLFVER